MRTPKPPTLPGTGSQGSTHEKDRSQAGSTEPLPVDGESGTYDDQNRAENGPSVVAAGQGRDTQPLLPGRGDPPLVPDRKERRAPAPSRACAVDLEFLGNSNFKFGSLTQSNASFFSVTSLCLMSRLGCGTDVDRSEVSPLLQQYFALLDKMESGIEDIPDRKLVVSLWLVVARSSVLVILQICRTEKARTRSSNCGEPHR